MKKIFTILMIFTLFVTVFTGCKQEKTASVVAKNLNSNLNKLEVAVTKLDSIDNKYLANPDIYSSISSTPTNNKGQNFALAFNELENNNFKEIVKQSLIDKINDTLTNQNYDTINNDCLTCKKYCDDNGNCYYTDCNNNNYCYNTNGDCSSCDKIPSTCTFVGNSTLCSETDNSELVATQISTNREIDSTNETIVKDNNIESDINYENINEEVSIDNEEIESVEENNLQEENVEPRVKVFYFTQESFAPIKLKYNPRYISQYNENTINDQIESYLFKVQKLYAMSEDSIEANTILRNCKNNIIDCIKEIKELNACIINGTCEPSIQELQALDNYIADIKTTTARLKDCNGELTKEVSKITESNSSSMINGVDVMNSNYMRLLNHIDTRITYHKSAIATLEQVRYLLDSATNAGEITEEEIQEIIEDITIEDTNNTVDINNEETTNSEELIEDNNENIIETNETLEDKENYDEETIVDDTDTPSNDINNEENVNTQSDNIVENKEETIIEDETTITDEQEITNENNDDKVLTEETIIEEDYEEDVQEETVITDSTNENIKNEEKIETNSDIVTEVDKKNTLIDTYNKQQSWQNIDTYRNNEEVVLEENNQNIDSNNENFVDNTDTTNNDRNNIENTDTTNETITENNNMANIDNENSVVNNGTTNGGINTIGDGTNNVNSGMYHNSVITQNNLNNNNGYGGYYYTNDGEIKNNGMNNNNEIGNNGETIENNLNRNNNVNTYGYNTMLDIINQGTVNNGINTL